jgi:hypothetical protein
MEIDIDILSQFFTHAPDFNSSFPDLNCIDHEPPIHTFLDEIAHIFIEIYSVNSNEFPIYLAKISFLYGQYISSHNLENSEHSLVLPPSIPCLRLSFWNEILNNLDCLN